MACPICGRMYCDHSPAERGQSFEEMMEDLRRDAERAKADEKSKKKNPPRP